MGCISTRGDRMAVNRFEITEKYQRGEGKFDGRGDMWWWWGVGWIKSVGDDHKEGVEEPWRRCHYRIYGCCAACKTESCGSVLWDCGSWCEGLQCTDRWKYKTWFGLNSIIGMLQCKCRPSLRNFFLKKAFLFKREDAAEIKLVRTVLSLGNCNNNKKTN